MARFAVLSAVGPGSLEEARLADLLDSLLRYEPAPAGIVLVDDAPTTRRLQDCFAFPPGIPVTVVPNPRRGRGQGWSGGLCVATLTGLATVSQGPAVDFVLKVDTDALVIAPFAERIVQAFAAAPHVGLVGTFRVNPDGQPRNLTPWSASVRTYLAPLTLRGKHVQCTLWGAGRRIKQTLRQALANGYQPAEHVQGGSWAVSGELVERMRRAGQLEHPLDWLSSGLGEDVMMGVHVRALGMDMLDLNGAGEPFGVQYQGLPAPPAQLVERGYGIIHSVKTFGDVKEEDVRAYFAERRHPSRKPVAAC